MPDVKELVKQLGADQETAFRAYKALNDMATRATAPGSEKEKQELARALAEQMTAREAPPKEEENDKKKKKNEKKEEPPLLNPPRVRVKLARLLSFVAGDAEMMTLIAALRDLEVREMARYALDFSNSDVATKGLIMALDDMGPEFRVGVIGALGRRSGSEVALKTLKEVATDDVDPQVRIAAVEMLAHFPDASADVIIEKVARGPFRERALVARVHLAETLRRAGKTDEAAKIYRAIEAGNPDQSQKRAAEIGLKAMA